ncbi:hypothetical protein [Agaribacter flavus]|uniref:Uncharacterized protein n=1 Tax=Agaribacter flavus TaxID=1902781 RepID=A0ABV7FIZ3_9ALTE
MISSPKAISPIYFAGNFVADLPLEKAYDGYDALQKFENKLYLSRVQVTD